LVIFLTPLARNTLSQKGSLGQAFAARSVTERQGQRNFCPCAPCVVSDRAEFRLGHLCYHFEDVPPQPNCPRGSVGGPDHGMTAACCKNTRHCWRSPQHRLSRAATDVLVFQRRACALPATLHRQHCSASLTTVKLNRVFFPRRLCQARSLDCGFAKTTLGTVGISFILSCTPLIRWQGIWLPQESHCYSRRLPVLEQFSLL